MAIGFSIILVISLLNETNTDGGTERGKAKKKPDCYKQKCSDLGQMTGQSIESVFLILPFYSERI